MIAIECARVSVDIPSKIYSFCAIKELRCNADDGVWRIAFAFDLDRKAILLVGGDKSGGSERHFYRQLIAKADERFDDHLQRIKGEK